MSSKRIFKVVFTNQGKVYEIYAGRVTHGDLYGFVEVAELRFNETSTVVVDPAQEKIRNEFEGVKSTHLPIHSILRIDEVDKQGTSKVFKAEGGNVAQFPVPMYTPGGDKS